MDQIKSCKATRLTIKNNGLYFNDDDWGRLREVAKGNPDETKIGAFGVGFYSVFEVTDEPLVHSGSSIMSFYFHEDQLCYRQETVKDSQGWTIMDLPYREPQELPNLPKFIEFLIQSFIFIPLESVRLQVDGTQIFQLKKSLSPPVITPAPKGELDCASPDKTMRLHEWKREDCQLSISYLNTKYRIFGLKNLKIEGYSELSTSFLRVTGKIFTYVSPAFAENLKATIMKPPPKEASISIISHKSSSEKLPEAVHKLLFPTEANQAKLYIGFPTKQTSSLKFHMSMNQLIPTMERAAVDLSNAHVKDWNAQLLHMAGLVVRILYNYEAKELQQHFPSDEFVDLASEFVNKYDVSYSSPEASVSLRIKAGFWKSGKAVLIPTQHGMVSSLTSRYAPDVTFMRKLSVIPQQLYDVAKNFFIAAIEHSALKTLDIHDVLQEVQKGPISKDQFSGLLKYYLDRFQINTDNFKRFQNVLKNTSVYEGDQDKVIYIKDFDCYQDPHTIPESFPIPHTCMPRSLAPDIPLTKIRLLYPQVLDVVDWALFAATYDALPENLDMRKSIPFAETALSHISRFWKSFNSDDRSELIRELGRVACVPTQHGLQRPYETYLAPIEMFEDLPVRTSDLAASKHFLTDIGVRETVNVETVIEAIQNPTPGKLWSNAELLQYLCKNKALFTKSDLEIMKVAKFLRANEHDNNLYSAAQLYSPNADLRTLHFNCIRWKNWFDNSPEAEFLYELGLKKFPPQQTILELAHDVDHYMLSAKESKAPDNCDIALKYYCENFERNNYNALEAFGTSSHCIPCIQNGKRTKQRPLDCYISSKAALFGFPVVAEYFEKDAYKFNIRAMDPLVSKLVDRLYNDPPKTFEDAEAKFSALSTLVNSFTKDDIEILKDKNFIPFQVNQKGVTSIIHLPPSRVFFAQPKGNKSKFYHILFRYSNFSVTSHPFLSTVGVLKEPSMKDVAQAMIKKPTVFFHLAETPKQYLELLIDMSLEWDSVAGDAELVKTLKNTPFLLAVKHIPVQETEKKKLDRYESRVNVQAKPSEIVIVDNVLYYNLFKDSIMTAPHEKTIEQFYIKLGAKRLSDIIEETRAVGRLLKGHDDVDKVKALVNERAFLFMQSTRDNVSSKADMVLDQLSVVAVENIERRLRMISSREHSSSRVAKSNSTACLEVKKKGSVTSTLYFVPDQLDWFEVSVALVGYLVDNPTPDSVIIFETMLRSSLWELQRKGFNTIEMLRKFGRDEDEFDSVGSRSERERIIAEAQAEFGVTQLTAADREVAAPVVPAVAKKGSFFSRLFGASDDPKPKKAPPPKKDKGKRASNSYSTKPVSNNNVHFSKRKPETAYNLNKGLTASRAYTKGMFHDTFGASQVEPDKANHMCDNSNALYLKKTTKQFKQGPTLFIMPPSMFDGGSSKDTVLSPEWEIEFQRFSFVLHTLTQTVFSHLKWDAVNIFLDETSATIAFNTHGALFFNLTYFVWNSVTATRMPGTKLRGWGSGADEWDVLKQLNYWFPIVAHEVAHNLANSHGVTHNHFMESYIQTYMPNMIEVSSKIAAGKFTVPCD